MKRKLLTYFLMCFTYFYFYYYFVNVIIHFDFQIWLQLHHYQVPVPGKIVWCGKENVIRILIKKIICFWVVTTWYKTFHLNSNNSSIHDRGSIFSGNSNSNQIKSLRHFLNYLRFVAWIRNSRGNPI